MANFLPLKNYILYCLDKIIKQCDLRSPFLDVGCGTGDVSAYMGSKGFNGIAIDFSPYAIEAAGRLLKGYPDIIVSHESLFQTEGKYSTILAFDILEHMEQDQEALNKISQLMDDNGHLVIVVPSNPDREWRWDDDFYGHVRRYSIKEITSKLKAASMEPVVFWDFTYPAFWLMRRMYTRLKKAPQQATDDYTTRTQESSVKNSWDIPVISWMLTHSTVLWKLYYYPAFHLFRNMVNKGHEMFVVARKTV